MSAAPATEDPAGDGRPSRRRSGRHTSAAVIGVLTLLLGFAIAAQVRANSGADALSGLRDDDLISILDNQNDRAERLREQQAALQRDLNQLRDSKNAASAARRQARTQGTALGILIGTVAATGPGVTVTISDPRSALGPEDLLAVLEELRGAGAEAEQIGNVRLSTNSSFTQAGPLLSADGTALAAPYRFVAIGAAQTLATALNIPGGVAATVRAAGGSLTVVPSARVTVSATRAMPPLTHATPHR